MIASPSIQCACSGHARTSVVQRFGSRSVFSAASPENMNTGTDQVCASPGSVSGENDG